MVGRYGPGEGVADLRAHLRLRQRRAASARRTGLVRGTAAHLAAEYGIPVCGGKNDPGRSRPDLPRDWKFDQYLNHHRSLADLAREKGLAKGALHDWAKIHQLPIQRHRAARMNVPAAVASCTAPTPPGNHLTGRVAMPPRLRRSHRHPAFGKAAATLGIRTSTLIGHVNRLECEYGRPLLERIGDTRIMRPTSQGQSVVAAAGPVEHRKQRARD